MIRLFRNIRRGKMKGAKYIKYALGEILLVVIGILIALQINNANEARKQRPEEKKLLQNLRVNFEKIKISLQQLDLLSDEGL